MSMSEYDLLQIKGSVGPQTEGSLQYNQSRNSVKRFLFSSDIMNAGGFKSFKRGHSDKLL